MYKKTTKFLYLLFFILIISSGDAVEIDDIQKSIKGLNTNFTASISYSSSTGELHVGKIYYQYPDKLHLQLSDGKVIATNGKYLWTYNSETKICARQAVTDENSGGLFYFLHGGYSVQEENGRYIFKGRGANLNEISIKVEDGNLKNVQFRTKDDVINVSFSNIITDTSMKASLFSYKPDPEAQLIENPLNKIEMKVN
ncbi:MAG: outer-membrane lipoprotein carrier protein LolA [Spirochaetia bacterium]|nr:outer-membrane lipoprotein carrier protein LolA [Spirochaetia bacterium]